MLKYFAGDLTICLDDDPLPMFPIQLPYKGSRCMTISGGYNSFGEPCILNVYAMGSLFRDRFSSYCRSEDVFV